MKKINKKISTVALAGMVVAGSASISQGLVGNLGSGYTPKTLLGANLLKESIQTGAYSAVGATCC